MSIAIGILIEVRINNMLEFPFLGGFNAPQFNEIDLNADGIMDLIIFDRSGNRLSLLLIKELVIPLNTSMLLNTLITSQNGILVNN